MVIARAVDSSPGAMLDMIRSGQAGTRADLARLTGLARSTVAQRVEVLLARGLVAEAGEGPSTGGRPPVRLQFNAGAGVVLAADLGVTHCRVAVADLGGTVLAEIAEDLRIAQGPDVVLSWLQDRFDELLAQSDHPRAQVRGIGVGLPGPVEFRTGRPTTPPIMPGWDGREVPRFFALRFPAPVLVDNDVNIMAVGEHWASWRAYDHMLFVKIGTGIGCGVIVGGRIHRGAQGAAGDIGHIRISNHNETVCHCGNVACLEAVAGGAALARQLTTIGIEASTTRDVAALVRAGNQAAVRLVRTAGRLIGDVLAAAVNLTNPSLIVIGGDLAAADEPLLAGVRESVYRQSPPLATRDLRIVRSKLDDRAGVTGAAVMIIEHVLSADAIDEVIAAASPRVAVTG